MNLKQLLTDTPELQALLNADEPDYKGVAALINAVPMVPNPIQTTPLVIRFPTMEEIFSKLTPGEAFRIQSSGRLEQNAKEAIDTKSYPRLVLAFKMIQDQKVELNISDTTISELQLLLGTLDPETQQYVPNMIPDPTYQSQIPGQSLAAQHNLGLITATDVMLAWFSASDLV